MLSELQPETIDPATTSASCCDTPAAAPYATRLDVCREWLDDTHRRLVGRLFGQSVPAKDLPYDDALGTPNCLVFVPRSQPERAHTVGLRDIDSLSVVAELSRRQWFVQDSAIDTALGPTGRLQMRLRAEWVIGPPAIKCVGLRPRQEPACIVAATAELPLDARQPRLIDCVICYDDARIAA